MNKFAHLHAKLNVLDVHFICEQVWGKTFLQSSCFMGDRSISEGFSLVDLWTHGLLTITIDDEAALILR